MSGSTLRELFGHILFGFTRGVREHYNPEEPEFTAESFGYNPLDNTGREWYYHPVDELIFQENSDREAISLDYLGYSGLHAKVIDACGLEENEEIQGDQRDEDKAMAWKQHRPSALCTICKSMYIGALISLLAATVVGALYMLAVYPSFRTVQNCQFYPRNSTSIQTQWIRSMSGAISCAFLYIWFFVLTLFLFRPFQLEGEKKKLLLVCFVTYTLDAICRVVLQAIGISHSNISNVQKIPLNTLFLINQCLKIYLLTNNFCSRSKQKLTLFFQMIVSGCFCFLTFFIVASLIYPAYNQQ